MDKESFLERIKEIGTCEDDIKRRDILTEVSTQIEKLFDESETLRSSNEKYAQDNETLREANMKLFLKANDSSKKEIDEPTFNEPEKEYKSYDEISSMFMK